MNLYRLDYVSPDGATEAVYDPLWRGAFLTQRATYARERAIHIAAETRRDVQITRISGAGTLKPTLVVDGITGRCHRPKS